MASTVIFTAIGTRRSPGGRLATGLLVVAAAAVASVVLVAGACRSAPGASHEVHDAPVVAGWPCDGALVLRVRNLTSQPVEIYVVTRGILEVLGVTATVSSDEFPLREQADFYAARPFGGRTPVAVVAGTEPGGGPRHARASDAVILEPLCRS